MPIPIEISAAPLTRRVDLPDAPVVLDVHTDETHDRPSPRAVP